MRPEWFRLEAGHAEQVWRDQRGTFLSQVVGPHFEALCRSYAFQAGAQHFDAAPAEAGSGVVHDPAIKTQIEIDIAVLGPAEHGRPRPLISLGEAKWGEVLGQRHVDKLARARDLLATRFDTTHTKLALYSAEGFSTDNPDIARIGLNDIYHQQGSLDPT